LEQGATKRVRYPRKEKLTSAPVLNYPDFSRQFLITTDASDYAIGTELSQELVGQD